MAKSFFTNSTSRAFLVFFAALLIASCTSEKKILNSCLGRTKADVIQAWGPPSRTEYDGAGNQILIYATHYYTPAGTTYINNSPINIPSQNYWHYRMLWVNSEQIIYYWKTAKQSIPPQEINVTIYNPPQNIRSRGPAVYHFDTGTEIVPRP